jgi:hypothetical protein
MATFKESSINLGIQIAREHKKADKEGTRAPVKANGLPVKAAAPKSKVRL